MPFETDLELEVAIGVVVAVAAAVVVAVVVPWALDDATWFAAAVDVAVDAVVADEQQEFVAASTLEAVVAAFEAVEVVAVIDLDPW